MKKSSFNILLYFPSAPSVFRGVDTQPFFLGVLLSYLKGSWVRWCVAFSLSIVFLIEAMVVGLPLDLTKLITFVLFVFLIFLLGDFSAKSSTINDNFVWLIIILSVVTSYFSLHWLFSDRPQANSFRSFPFTFPEASYAAKFFYFYAILKLLHNRKLGSMDLLLPSLTLSLTGAFLTVHLLMLRSTNLTRNILTLMVVTASLFLISQFFYLGRVTDLITNFSDLPSFILSDASFNTRTRYLTESQPNLVFSSLGSLILTTKVTMTLLISTLILVAFKNGTTLKKLCFLFSTVILLSYSDTYVQPYGVLCLAFLLRSRQ